MRAAARRCVPAVVGLAGLLAFGALAPPQAAAQVRVRESTYRALSRADREIAAERYAEALEILDAMASRAQRVPLERALVQQSRAVALIAQQRYEDAVPALEMALGADALPGPSTARLRFNLLQLDLVRGEPARALGRIESWFGDPASAPPAEILALAGRAHFELEAYGTAAARLREAIAAEPDPPLWWYELLLGCDYATENHAGAFRVLRVLLERNPSEARYWVGLARVALELGREDVALAAVELAEDADPLEATHVVLLVRLNLQAGIPARAGRLLQDALDTARIPADATHLELLATAWTLAREYEPACDALQRAAALAPADRDSLLLRRGELLLQLGREDEAREDLAVAGASDDPTTAARASLLLGVALYREREYARSLAAFAVAARDASVRDEAREWERFVRARSKRD